MSWPTTALGNVVDVAAGQAAPPAASFSQAGTPFIRAGSVEGLVASANWEDLEHLTEDSAKKRRMKLFPPETVLFAKSGMSAALGRVFKIDRPAYVVSHLAALKPTGKADPAFLTHWLRHYGTQRLIKDPAYPSIRLADVQEMPFPDIPRLEQQRIAGILDQADALRRLRRRSLSRFSDLGQAIFYEMFGNVRTNDRNWFDGATLLECAEVVSGITKGRKLNGQATREIPYMTVATVQDGYLKLDSVKSIEATDREIERYRLLRDDILLTEGGDPDKLGRGAMWSGELPECIHQNHVFRVRVHDDRITPTFATWLIGSSRGKAYFLRAAKQTTGIASINSTQLKQFPLLLPPIALQTEFSRRLKELEYKKRAMESAFDESELLFASLQHRAFRGEL